MTVASLSGRLLARKGAARPSAMNGRQPFVSDRAAAQQVAAVQTPAGGERARISLRLDPVRHRRLRIAAAHLDCSLQDLLIAALDAHLADLVPACPCLRFAGDVSANGCAEPPARQQEDGAS